MYAINLNEEKRILRATFEQYADKESIIVAELPEGDITEYKYINGKYTHDPLPKVEVIPEPTQLDKIEAQVTYTAMMSGTLLEV